jgi:Tol biopolymer transport system component
MTDLAANGVLPSWSRDGRWIYFTSDRSGSYEVWKVPKEGGQAVRVTRSGGYAAFESPDGRYIYYTKWVPAPQPQSLFRMPVEGGEETQIHAQVFDWASYAVTSKGIYFTPDAKEIQRLDLATGKVSTLTVLEKAMTGAGALCVSPDDTYLVWQQLDRTALDLMVVENFR